MILASLSDCQQYYSIDPLFRRAFEFYDKKGRFLEEGRHIIDGDDIHLIISHNELRTIEDAPLEAHDKYIDIQILMEGCESYGVRNRSKCLNSQNGYDAEQDIEFFNDQFSNIVTLQEGDFVVFFPKDAHAPLIGRGEIKKAIFKIKVK